MEGGVQADGVGEWPALRGTGERELDRIGTALNEAGHRLANARDRADQLARQMAIGERLAAIGRVAAGVAHEIRNPIAAMRLKAENAIAGDADRKNQSLSTIVEQIDRLDGVLRRLLSATERDKVQRRSVALAPFINSSIAEHAELARSKRLSLELRLEAEAACFDPDQMRRALDNLILNAIQAAPPDTPLLISTCPEDENLILSVHDAGGGPPSGTPHPPFHPFLSGRADGTGLGLSLVREVAAAHGGAASVVDFAPGKTLEVSVA